MTSLSQHYRDLLALTLKYLSQDELKSQTLFIDKQSWDFFQPLMAVKTPPTPPKAPAPVKRITPATQNKAPAAPPPRPQPPQQRPIEGEKKEPPTPKPVPAAPTSSSSFDLTPPAAPPNPDTASLKKLILTLTPHPPIIDDIPTPQILPCPNNPALCLITERVKGERGLTFLRQVAEVVERLLGPCAIVFEGSVVPKAGKTLSIRSAEHYMAHPKDKAQLWQDIKTLCCSDIP